MSRDAGLPPRRQRRTVHRNAVLRLYDQPLYLDWAFWMTLGFTVVTALSIGTSDKPSPLPRWLNTSLATITFTVLFGVLPAWLRLLVRRWREQRRPTSQPPSANPVSAAQPRLQWKTPSAASQNHAANSAPPISTPVGSAPPLNPRSDRGTPGAARYHPGSVAVPLRWRRLDADGFERLLFDLLRAFPEHHNVQWLSHTRAADRGRDLSMDRVLYDSTGSVRTERVIVQAKHWLAKTVDVPAVSGTVAAMRSDSQTDGRGCRSNFLAYQPRSGDRSAAGA